MAANLIHFPDDSVFATWNNLVPPPLDIPLLLVDGVQPRSSEASTLAPCSSRQRTTPEWPLYEAVISGVQPSWLVASMCAPFSTRTRTASAWPYVAAYMRAVQWHSSVAFTWEPLSMSARRTAMSPSPAACMSGVLPAPSVGAGAAGAAVPAVAPGAVAGPSLRPLEAWLTLAGAGSADRVGAAAGLGRWPGAVPPPSRVALRTGGAGPERAPELARRWAPGWDSLAADCCSWPASSRVTETRDGEAPRDGLEPSGGCEARPSEAALPDAMGPALGRAAAGTREGCWYEPPLPTEPAESRATPPGLEARARLGPGLAAVPRLGLGAYSAPGLRGVARPATALRGAVERPATNAGLLSQLCRTLSYSFTSLFTLVILVSITLAIPLFIIVIPHTTIATAATIIIISIATRYLNADLLFCSGEGLRAGSLRWLVACVASGESNRGDKLFAHISCQRFHSKSNARFLYTFAIYASKPFATHCTFRSARYRSTKLFLTFDASHFLSAIE